MERINALLVGAPRQGKTYFGEKKLIDYARHGGCSVVYNVGRLTDFRDFIPVELMTVQEFRDGWERKNQSKMASYMVPREIEYFKANGLIYHLSSFSKMFRGKCVKIERVTNAGQYRNEDYFIAAIYRYFFNTLIMFDDCRTIFRKGLSSEMIGLLSRINHAGKHFTLDQNLVGVDIILTYHGFDTVNIETYQFVNMLIQFRTMFLPSMKIDNSEVLDVITDNYFKLQDLQKYSHFECDLFTMKNKLFTP